MTPGGARVRCALGLLLVLCCVAARAHPAATDDEPEPAGAIAPIARDDPQRMIGEATGRLLDIARAARARSPLDRERYFAEVAVVLDEVVDVAAFTRGVMGTWGSARLYASLEGESQRAAFRARAERFVAASRRVFLVRYADALLDFDGPRIDLASTPGGSGADDRAAVTQTIHAADGTNHVVQYSLRRGDDGRWRVVNVIVEGVNLGEIYRTQFAQAVEAQRGDVDRVVDEWVARMARPAGAGAS